MHRPRLHTDTELVPGILWLISGHSRSFFSFRSINSLLCQLYNMLRDKGSDLSLHARCLVLSQGPCTQPASARPIPVSIPPPSSWVVHLKPGFQHQRALSNTALLGDVLVVSATTSSPLLDHKVGFQEIQAEVTGGSSTICKKE